MEPTQCSETSAFNTQTPGKYPEDNLSLLQHGESLKTRSQHSLVILSCSNNCETLNDGYSVFRYEQDTHTNGRKYFILFRLRLHY